MKTLLLLLLIFGSDNRWNGFPPLDMTRFGCKVTDATRAIYGQKGPGNEIWEAEAYAEGKVMWGQTIAEYPHTKKGLHDAEKDCQKWVDEAEKRTGRK